MRKQTKAQRVALVTGGAKRIGKAICLSLSSKGYAIALHYNSSKSESLKVADLIKERKGSCTLFPCDLSDKEATVKLIPQVLDEFGRLDVLINSASIFKPSKIKDAVLTSFDQHFAVNLRAPYILTAQFAKRCRKGTIINILDTHITDNKTSHADYLLSKKALAQLTKMAALELAPNIRVNAIAPGLILPPAKAPSGYLSKLAKKVPLKNKGNVEQITQTVDFLIDNSYITGQIIFNDGGEHLMRS